MSEAPNLYAVFIALIQMIGTAFAVYIAYRQTIAHNKLVASNLASKVDETNAQTTTKLDAVHETVNGNLHRANERAEKYARLLRLNGIEPESF